MRSILALHSHIYYTKAMHRLAACLVLGALSLYFVEATASLSRYDCDYSSARCEYLPEYVYEGQLSQRDVSENTTIDNLTLLVADFNNSIAYDGYTQAALERFSWALDFGYQAFDIDVYNYQGAWQLCPGIFPPSTADGSQGTIYENLLGNNNLTYSCQKNLTLDSIYSTVMSYVLRSDLEITANLVLLNLKLHTLDPSGIDRTEYQAQNLSNTGVSTSLGSRVLKPSTITRYPTYSEFLFTYRVRALINVQNVSLSQHLKYDLESENATFFTNFTDTRDSQNIYGALDSITSLDYCPHNVSLPGEILEVESSTWNNHTLRYSTSCGYSPVYMSEFSDYKSLVPGASNVFWSWAPRQPSTEESSSADSTTSTSPAANQCALLESDGWVVGNCYDEHHILCRSNDTRSVVFKISNSSTTYFETADSCPDGYVFTVPTTPYEQRLAFHTKAKANISSIWIDWNCLAASGCWVTGGVSASCPYHRYSINRNGVALLSVATGVTAFMFVMTLLLMWLPVPFRHKQAKWKRVYNKYAEREYDGVPA